MGWKKEKAQESHSHLAGPVTTGDTMKGMRDHKVLHIFLGTTY